MKPQVNQGDFQIIQIGEYCPIILYIVERYEWLFSNKKEQTRQTYIHNGKRFLNFLKSEKEFKADTLDRFVLDVDSSDAKQNTKAAWCTAARTLVKRVNHYRQDLIPDGIYKRLVSDVGWIVSKKGSTRKGQTLPELERIKDAVFEMQEESPDLYQLYKCQLALFSIQGLRVSEAARLQVKDINFNKKLIDLTLKGGDEKAVDMLTDVAEIVNSYLKYFDIKSSFLFPYKETHMSRQMITMRWKRLFLKMGMSEYSVHDFRHFVGTTVARKTNDPYAVAQALNHSSIQTGQRYIDDLKKEETSKKLDNILKY